MRLEDKFPLKEGKIGVTSPGVYYVYAQVGQGLLRAHSQVGQGLMRILYMLRWVSGYYCTYKL